MSKLCLDNFINCRAFNVKWPSLQLISFANSCGGELLLKYLTLNLLWNIVLSVQHIVKTTPLAASIIPGISAQSTI